MPIDRYSFARKLHHLTAFHRIATNGSLTTSVVDNPSHRQPTAPFAETADSSSVIICQADDPTRAGTVQIKLQPNASAYEVILAITPMDSLSLLHLHTRNLSLICPLLMAERGFVQLVAAATPIG